MKTEKIKIDSEYIKLQDLLKLAVRLVEEKL